MTRLLLGVGLCALAACDQVFGVQPPLDAISTSGDSSDALSATCFGRDIVIQCFDTAPDGELVLAGELDTATDARCAVDIDLNACVIAADEIRIEVGSILRAIGSRPLVLVANTINVKGTIDVAGRLGMAPPAGANNVACSEGRAPDDGPGGGYGGTYGSSGAPGGGAPNGVGGMPGTMQPSRELRAGCRGGAGAGATPGGGGTGGGAIALVARDTLMITGAVNASGGGGGGGGLASGGGGGGSGGTIVIDARDIVSFGEVFANGGGGGEGGGSSTVGVPGETTSTAHVGGRGGFTGTIAGAGGGGNGAHRNAAAAVGENGTSGGGGGGGLGVIYMFFEVEPAPGGHYSPAPSQ